VKQKEKRGKDKGNRERGKKPGKGGLKGKYRERCKGAKRERERKRNRTRIKGSIEKNGQAAKVEKRGEDYKRERGRWP
jgi:hypothetical protein